MTSFLNRAIAGLAVVLLAAAPSLAATLSALTTFGGGDGFLAPGDRTYLTTDNTQRGIAYNPSTGHVVLVNRAGALSIHVLDGATGADLGTLNQGSGIISSGTFTGSMIAAGDDGALYMANLTTNATTTPFKLYRWENETAAAPTVAFSGAPLAGARIGDSLDAIGAGASTRLVAGYNNNPNVAGNNSFALFTTADGVSYAGADIAVPTNPPAAGDFRFGITFTDSDTVIGKSTTNGRIVDITGPTSGTLASSFTLDALSINPMDWAVIGGVPVLAAVNTSSTGESKLFVYNMSNPATPVLIASGDNLPGAANANGNGVGQVRFGAVGATSAVIYALNTNNGIQAFELTGVPEPMSAVMLVLGAATLAGVRRARRVEAS